MRQHRLFTKSCELRCPHPSTRQPQDLGGRMKPRHIAACLIAAICATGIPKASSSWTLEDQQQCEEDVREQYPGSLEKYPNTCKRPITGIAEPAKVIGGIPKAPIREEYWKDCLERL